MKFKFILYLLLLSITFKSMAAGDDLTGKALYCEDKDLVVYLEFNSRSDVDVHFLKRYAQGNPYVSPSDFPRYKYALVETKYDMYEARRDNSPHQIQIDSNPAYERYQSFNLKPRWMYVIRDTLELHWSNWLHVADRNVNYPGEGAGKRYREYYGYNIGMTPIFCIVEKKNASEVKEYIESRAKFLNDIIVRDILELKDELDRREIETKSTNKI